MSVCGNCKAHYGSTCCEVPRGQTPTFGLTKAEVVRILKHVRKSFKDCFEVDFLTDEELREFAQQSDVFAKTFAGGKRIRLKVVDQGPTASCVFLKKGVGCTLPKDIRPHACRLFPFWVERAITKGGHEILDVVVGPFSAQPCLAKLTAKSGSHLLSMFDVDEEKLKDVARLMFVDAEDHADEFASGESKGEAKRAS